MERVERPSAPGAPGTPRRAGRIGGSNRLLSVDEVADLLGVSSRTVHARWRDWGLPGYRIGRYLRFRERHLDDWIDHQQITDNPPRP
ncbi:MAG TPA: helix-turn-helix domain-containing protein [Actinocatenispora sp.]